MAPLAFAIHRTSGRLRLRIPDRRHDSDFFAELAQRLGALPGVRDVAANPASAGVLIRLDPDSALDPLRSIEGTGLVRVMDGPPPLSPALSGVRRAARRIDEALGEASGNILDLRTLGFGFLVLLAFRQALRGQIAAPAVPLFWYAFELLRFVPPDHPEDGGPVNDQHRRSS
jgi:hypothetical protein